MTLKCIEQSRIFALKMKFEASSPRFYHHHCPSVLFSSGAHTLSTCREIETMKERYESKLSVERKLAVTLKGENGLMRKRFNGLEKSIDEQKSEIRRLHEAQETLYTTIATHEKDIQAYKEVCQYK